jgi:hypothetical protein
MRANIDNEKSRKAATVDQRLRPESAMRIDRMIRLQKLRAKRERKKRVTAISGRENALPPGVWLAVVVL